MNTVAHRRQYTRYPSVFSMKYTLKEGRFRDLISNIGAGGVFISTRRKVKLGRAINIQFPIFAFGENLSVMGTVIRCDPEGFAVMFDEACEVKLFKDGKFPGNVTDDSRSAIKIDKNCIS